MEVMKKLVTVAKRRQIKTPMTKKKMVMRGDRNKRPWWSYRNTKNGCLCRQAPEEYPGVAFSKAKTTVRASCETSWRQTTGETPKLPIREQATHSQGDERCVRLLLVHGIARRLLFLDSQKLACRRKSLKSVEDSQFTVLHLSTAQRGRQRETE
uniref:Uncharacterized protein n=1 Tax=Toxoplasma gondii TgCATBr9 TaxID=943120 RepID=A0A2T6IEB8_TOXGO|nr:hypothetical protein TGBR9_240820 [Toxoplasma gondii TgCATBr9]